MATGRHRKAASIVKRDLVALKRAYYATCYRIEDKTGHAINLYPGQSNSAMDTLLQVHGSTCAYVVTACNPRSQAFNPNQNSQAMQSLRDELARFGWTYFAAWGCAIDASWPPEESVLVLGAHRAPMLALAENYEQYAVLEHVAGHASSLLFTRVYDADCYDAMPPTP